MPAGKVMENWKATPGGVTESVDFRNGKAVSYGYQPTGWRKTSVDLVQAESFAREGEQLEVPKSQAFVAVKRVAAHIGLKAGDVLLLDVLGAFTQTKDWEAGQRPIVWASNAYLMDQTGFSLSALKRHARRLVQIGVIAFKDSPNGKRWGHRDPAGYIIEAYGYDLSPLAARAGEFTDLFEDLRKERALCQRLKRQITITRRVIRARLEAALSKAWAGPWTDLAKSFDGLLERLPRRKTASNELSQLFERFQALLEHVELAFEKAVGVDKSLEEGGNIDSEAQKKNPREVNNDPHIQTTKQLYPVNCNSSEKEETTGVAEPHDAGLREETSHKGDKPRGTSLDLPTVMQACPEFATWARNTSGYLTDWGDVYRAAGQLRGMIGVSEHAWTQAQDKLGPQLATAALVLTFDKHCTGEVASPGGYLRGMIDKAGAGELHLERSFYGRLSVQAA